MKFVHDRGIMLLTSCVMTGSLRIEEELVEPGVPKNRITSPDSHGVVRFPLWPPVQFDMDVALGCRRP